MMMKTKNVEQNMRKIKKKTMKNFFKNISPTFITLFTSYILIYMYLLGQKDLLKWQPVWCYFESSININIKHICDNTKTKSACNSLLIGTSREKGH